MWGTKQRQKQKKTEKENKTTTKTKKQGLNLKKVERRILCPWSNRCHKTTLKTIKKKCGVNLKNACILCVRPFRKTHFAQGLPQKIKVLDVKTTLSCETSPTKWKWKMWKRSFRARPPSKSGSGRCENEAFRRDILQNLNVGLSLLWNFFAMIPLLWNFFVVKVLCSEFSLLWDFFAMRSLCCETSLPWDLLWVLFAVRLFVWDLFAVRLALRLCYEFSLRCNVLLLWDLSAVRPLCLRSVCYEISLLWDLFVMRSLCCETSLLWDFFAMRSLCCEASLLWGFFALRFLAVKLLCCEISLLWVLFAVRSLCCKTSLLWDPFAVKLLCCESSLLWVPFAVRLLCYEISLLWDPFAVRLAVSSLCCETSLLLWDLFAVRTRQSFRVHLPRHVLPCKRQNFVRPPIAKNVFRARLPWKSDSGRCEKRSFRARLPSKSESWRCENEAFVRGLPQNRRAEDVVTKLSRETSRKTWTSDISLLWNFFAMRSLCCET